jgi:hypothetical protein
LAGAATLHQGAARAIKPTEVGDFERGIPVKILNDFAENPFACLRGIFVKDTTTKRGKKLQVRGFIKAGSIKIQKAQPY